MKCSFFAVLLVQFCFAQNTYPTDYFCSPLDIPLTISGNFGELRTNHFHAGLDFRTQQKEGLNVYASAEGYVSRIKISTFGYGKAIYISHPNGYTTVYGHLKMASPAIQKYIKEQHYKEKAFEIDVFPKPDELIIKEGEFIALSGNTGGSGGPHLHFEIRDSKTEKIINPMFFGFDRLMADTRLPQIGALMAYPINNNSVVNESQKPTLVNLSLQKDGTFLSEKIKANGKIGFSINAWDLMDFSYSKNGLYKVESFVNGKPHFGYTFDTFGFDEGKFINALLDYPRFANTGVRFQKLFTKNPYGLSILKSTSENGIINIVHNLTTNYRIEISDFNNNKIIVNIPIIFSENAAKVLREVSKSKILLKSKIENIYSKENITVSVPENTFYEDFYLDFEVKNDTLTFADESFAQHNAIVVTFKKNMDVPDKSKVFIATIEGKKLIYNKTKNKDDEFITYTKNLGKMILAQDTTKPKITPLTLAKTKTISKQKSIDFSISDDLSGIKEYNGYINGEWVLFDYDFKSKKLSYNMSDDFVKEGNNELKLVVSDNLGNSTIFETSFIYQKL
jgi:murein DD-endopeptidase MepM/ murein hydrolase activator NlpD